jgi:hypothetical protein
MARFVIFFFILASLEHAAPPTSRNRTTPGLPLVSEEQTQDWLRIWQKRLRLEDWKIEVKIVRIWELEHGTLGHIDWSTPRKVAVIKVLNPADYELPPDKIPADMELSIVHELVHLHLSVLPLAKSSRVAEEQVVTMIADALMNLEHNPVPTE